MKILRRNHRFALKMFLCSVGFVFVLWLILFLTILSEDRVEYSAAYTVKPKITDNRYIQHEFVNIPPCVGIGKDCEVIPDLRTEQPVVNTVPEPSSLLLLVLPLIYIWRLRSK